MESLKGKIPNEKLEALKRLGFYEETPPRVSENGNLVLKNSKFNYYPKGMVLQISSGYIRDRGVTSGFIKRDLDLEQMVDYLINRWEKYERGSKDSGLSDKVYITIVRSTTRFKLNPKTKRVDANGDLYFYGESISELLKEGVKFGEVSEFSLNGFFKDGIYSKDHHFDLSVKEARQILPISCVDLYLRGIKIEGEIYNVYIRDKKWSPEGRLELIKNGEDQEKKLVFLFLSPEEIQKLIDENPEETVMALKSMWKNYKTDPEYKNLKFPKGLESDLDLLSDLNDIGL